MGNIISRLTLCRCCQKENSPEPEPYEELYITPPDLTNNDGDFGNPALVNSDESSKDSSSYLEVQESPLDASRQHLQHEQESIQTPQREAARPLPLTPTSPVTLATIESDTDHDYAHLVFLREPKPVPRPRTSTENSDLAPESLPPVPMPRRSLAKSFSELENITAQNNAVDNPEEETPMQENQSQSDDNYGNTVRFALSDGKETPLQEDQEQTSEGDGGTADLPLTTGNATPTQQHEQGMVEVNDTATELPAPADNLSTPTQQTLCADDSFDMTTVLPATNGNPSTIPQQPVVPENMYDMTTDSPASTGNPSTVSLKTLGCESVYDMTTDIAVSTEEAQEESLGSCSTSKVTQRPLISEAQCRINLQIHELSNSRELSQIHPIPESVSLGGQSLLKIPDTILSCAMSVKVLNLTSNRAISMADDIRHFQSLTWLCLKDCYLSELPNGVLSLTMLKYLDLSNSRSTFDRTSENNNVSFELEVKTRYMGSGISELPSDINKLSALEELYVSGNPKLATLPPAMEELQLMKKLDISWCGFTELPEVCKRIASLQCLQAGGIMMKIVPKEIATLPKLKMLELAECDIRKIPDDFGLMKSLEKISFHGNANLQDISTKLTYISRLRMLTLSDCGITALPSEIGNFQQLEILDVSFNSQLHSFPSSIEELQKLKTLKLSGCNFSELPDTLKKLTELRNLDVSNNHLEAYPQVTFQMQKLTSLNLSNTEGCFRKNNIEQIPLQIIGSKFAILKMDNNPVHFPPIEVCRRGINEIRHFITELLQNGYIYADTVTVIGEKNAGKSSVVRSLAHKRPCMAEQKNIHKEVDDFYISVDDFHWMKVLDFDGCSLSPDVVSLLSPSEGLKLIVHDMTKFLGTKTNKTNNVEDFEGFEDLQKWILSQLRTCHRNRIIVVLTHADKMEETMKDAIEKKVKVKVSELIESIEEECREYLREMSPNHDVALVEQNARALERVSQFSKGQNQIGVLALSCSQQNDLGIRFLVNFIKDKLRPNKPARYSAWWRLVCDIITHRPADEVPYLDWETFSRICRARPHTDDPVTESIITDLVKYLRDTSQVIWIEEHRTLSKYVFHCPLLILKACRSIVTNFGQQGERKESKRRCYKSVREQCQADGCISDRLLHQLLLLPPASASVVADLLKHSNIICEVARAENEMFYASAVGLPDEPSAEVAFTEEKLQPRISVRLNFLDSIWPRDFSYNSLAVILRWAHSRDEQPLMWKQGGFFRISGVSVIINQGTGFMNISVTSGSETDNLWSTMMPLLSLISHKDSQHGRGAPPHAIVECPGCRCCGRCPLPINPTERDIKSISKLMDPEAREPGSTRYCFKCKKNIPRCLIFSQKAGQYTSEDQQSVQNFLTELRCSCKCLLESADASRQRLSGETMNKTESTNEVSLMNDSTTASDGQNAILAKKIRARRTLLIQELTPHDVMHVVDKLYEQSFVSPTVKDSIEAKRRSFVASDATRELLDLVENPGNKCAAIFIEVLLSDKVNKAYLVDSINDCKITENK